MKRLRFAKNVITVSFFTALTTLLSFLLQIILAKNFGTSFKMDAYFTATAIPVFLFTITASALTSVFVPIYKRIKENKGEAKAQGFFLSILFLFFLTYLSISATIFLNSSLISNLIIPKAIPQTLLLTTTLLRILSFYILFQGLSFVFHSLYIANKKFFLPYFATFISTLTNLTYTSAFINKQGLIATAWGYSLGSVLSFTIMLLPFAKNISKIEVQRYNSLKYFLKIFLPFSLASFFYRLTPLIDRHIASHLSSGNISTLGYSFKLIQTLNNILSQSLSITFLPLVSHYAARSQDKLLSKNLSFVLRFAAFLIFPIALILFFTSKEIVALLFQRGNFTLKDVEKVGLAFSLYQPAFIFLSFGGIISSLLYAKHKHLKVAKINLFLLPFYISLAYYLSKKIGVYGIIISYDLFTLVGVIAYIYLIRDIFKKIFKSLIRDYTKILLSSVASLFPVIVINQHILIKLSIFALTYLLLTFLLFQKEVEKIRFTK